MQIETRKVLELSNDPANARKHSERKLRPNMRTGEDVACKHCGKQFYKRKSEPDRKFCGTVCAANAKRKYVVESKVCNHCGGGFKFSAKPSSNSAGKFCSLECRNASYIGTYRGKPARNVKTHRPGWASISRRFRRLNDFCSGCGTTDGRLAVHHVDPYWRSKNNDNSNLVTLCPKCHGRAELLSDKILEMKPQQRQVAVALIQAELHDWWHIFQGRRILQECT